MCGALYYCMIFLTISLIKHIIYQERIIMKISVCIITKNEEKVIERLLNCIKVFADEIILVDTGSCDKTVKIARQYTDNVYNFDWIDDFSKARNFAIEKATCEYILWLDADDFITEENAKKILKLKREKRHKDTYMFKYLCGFSVDGKPTFEFYRERLLRNCKKARFKGFIHEAIPPFGEIEYTDIEIEHRKVNSGNPRRNLEIYKKHEKLGEVFSPRDTYYFAKEYYYLGYLYTSKKYLVRFLKMSNVFLPDVLDAYFTLYEIANKLQLARPEKYLFNCLEKCGANGELLCKIADFYYQSGEKQKSVDYLKFALLCKKPLYGFVKSEYYYIYPLLNLTKLCYEMGMIEESKYYHQKCENENPNHPSVVFNRKFFENN